MDEFMEELEAEAEGADSRDGSPMRRERLMDEHRTLQRQLKFAQGSSAGLVQEPSSRPDP